MNDSNEAAAEMARHFGEGTAISLLLDIADIDAALDLPGWHTGDVWSMIVEHGCGHYDPEGRPFALPSVEFREAAGRLGLAPATQLELLKSFMELKYQKTGWSMGEFLAAVTEEPAAPGPEPAAEPVERPHALIMLSHTLPQEDYDAFRKTVESGELEVIDQPVVNLPIGDLFFQVLLAGGDTGLYVDAYLCDATGEIVFECPPRDSPYGKWEMAPKDRAPVELEITPA